MKYTWEDDLKLALALVDISDSLCLQNFRHAMEEKTKEDGSPVTKLDKEIEAKLLSAIEKARPADNIISEESRHQNQSAELGGRTWIIDPLDHTRHFIKGNPDYGTLIALSVDSEPYIGVVSAPSLDCRWWAVVGKGAWANGKSISVSKTNSIKAAYLGIAGHREWHSPYSWESVCDLLNNVEYPFGTAGGFWPCMLVADGQLDAFVEPWGHIWDHAASAAIIIGAGGKVTTLDGGAPRGRSLLASNGALHQQILPYFKT